MSLRFRLILLLVLVNLALLGIAQGGAWWLQRRWVQQNQANYERRVWDEALRFAYSGYDGGATFTVTTARRLLSPEFRQKLAIHFSDVLITSAVRGAGGIDLNPMGAVQRDPRAFPNAAVRDGLQAAIDGRALVSAANGFCLPIVVHDVVVGGAWFEPKLPPPPQLPSAVFSVPLLAGTLVFGLLASFVIGRTLVRPLRGIGETARRIGEGRYEARITSVRVPELDVVIEAFNAMAERIEGHHAELAHEVQRATEETQRKERAMLQSARLAAMGTLAAGIAHEINNPIGGMQNAIRRIERNEHLSERERLYVALIRDGLERVGRIARRVLDFSPRSLEARPFELAESVEGARALVEHRIVNQGVELSIDLPPGLPRLVGDPHEFQQVLLNLLINALDVLEGRPAPRRIEVRARQVGGELELVVQDNGPGMAKADLGRVMDPFYSGKGRPDSSGLGMFISYSIVRNHGGVLEVDSEPGLGFTARVRVPIGDSP